MLMSPMNPWFKISLPKKKTQSHQTKTSLNNHWPTDSRTRIGKLKNVNKEQITIKYTNNLIIVYSKRLQMTTVTGIEPFSLLWKQALFRNGGSSTGPPSPLPLPKLPRILRPRMYGFRACLIIPRSSTRHSTG